MLQWFDLPIKVPSLVKFQLKVLVLHICNFKYIASPTPMPFYEYENMIPGHGIKFLFIGTLLSLAYEKKTHNHLQLQIVLT